MNRIKVINKIEDFQKLNQQVMDLALERMSKDILQISKIKVPFKEGTLQKSGEYERKEQLHFWVKYTEPYSAYQNRGMRADGSRVVRRYTTPSTNKGFLSNAGQTIARNVMKYYKQAFNSIKL